MPTTGIPFPLLSFGGSSALTVWLAAGLILNVARRVAAAGPVIDTRSA
jgi:cell division protein FtsW (lipid II flippase)